MKKKVVALLLSATMVMGMAMSVGASSITDMEGAGSGSEVTGDSTMNLPIINIDVPTTANIVLNPFQLTYTSDDLDGTAVEDNAQVISAEQEIKSNSNVDIAVNIEDLKATPSDGVTIATKSVADGKTTTKSAFLYLEVVGSDAEFGETYASTNASQVIVPLAVDGKIGTTKSAIVTLAKNDTEETDDDTSAKFKICGDLVANPTVTENKVVTAAPWTESDTISVAFKFTFTPQIVTATP